MNASIPVINAGDGGHNHPTQTLADLLTIYREKGRFDRLTVGLCGDLKYGRTVHSLISALSRYPGVRFVLISPEELKLPSYVKKEVLAVHGIPYEQTEDLEAAMPALDILYMTRIQRERFPDPTEYERLKDSYILQYAKKLGLGIGIVGLYNIQFIVDREENVYIIEVNPRSSRTVPFLSKATGYSLADIATEVILGKSLKEQGIFDLYPEEKKRYYGPDRAGSRARRRDGLRLPRLPHLRQRERPYHPRGQKERRGRELRDRAALSPA